MNTEQLCYRLAEKVMNYGEPTSYQLGDLMQDAIQLAFVEKCAKDETLSDGYNCLYFGIRPTGTVLLYQTPGVSNIIRDYDRAITPHEWWRLEFDRDCGGWMDPVRVLFA